MSPPADTAPASSIADLLRRHERSDLLRLLTCGSVDDGKSTLIGRLLHDSKTLYEDHLASLEADSRRVGSAGGAIDFSLLLDGLKAEREQGITIDVAYRYFSTPRRKFIIADCPGHEQYTRNMVTGASTANLAIVLCDARAGILPQTRRHSFIASLLDIGHVVVAVNKMDLVDWSRDVFERIRAEFVEFATRLEVRSVHFIPISALEGDNVVEPSARMPWYRGVPLLDYLETVHIASDRNLIDLRFPVQLALRQDASFRGFAGTLASGILRPGVEVMVLPSRQRTRVRSVVTWAGEIEEAFPPMAVSVTTEDEVDISRGDMLVHPRNLPRVGQEIDAVLVWMSETPLDRQRTYRIKHTTREAHAEVSELRYRFDVNTLHRLPADSLALNEIGRVRVQVSRALAYDPYRRNRSTGSFILIDPVTNGTVAAGMILDRSRDEDDAAAAGAGGAASGAAGARSAVARGLLRPHPSRVGPSERAERLGQQAATVWLTGLPCSGKSTIAYALERRLFDAGYLVHVLDGENLRLGISENLGFGAVERSENVRRAAHVAKLASGAGLITVVALVSPGEADRAAARAIVGAERFIEVYLSAPVEVCEARDQEGLYRRARAGEVERFTGVSAPYEPPRAPDLALPTHEIAVEDSVARVVDLLAARGVLRR
ncbi:MAG TPA: sulfate adenylyltransferase subunit CysN [Kofleriaceae bacterium]|nr:sulfate adenylyltransferase subunit CysN [Kofleriaceae bacterium]